MNRNEMINKIIDRVKTDYEGFKNFYKKEGTEVTNRMIMADIIYRFHQNSVDMPTILKSRFFQIVPPLVIPSQAIAMTSQYILEGMNIESNYTEILNIVNNKTNQKT